MQLSSPEKWMKKDKKHLIKKIDRRRSKKGARAIITLLLALIAVIIIAVSTGVIQIHQLRADLNQRLSYAAENIDSGRFQRALGYSSEALALAERLRDNDAITEINTQIRYIETIIRGDQLFGEGRYQTAKEAYILATRYLSNLQSFSAVYVEDMILTTERYIEFYALLEQAESLFHLFDLEAAILVYEEAGEIAEKLSFAEGLDMVAEGIASVRERITLVKIYEGHQLILLGDERVARNQYEESIPFFVQALEIFEEVQYSQGIELAGLRIIAADRLILERDQQQEPDQPQAPQEPGVEDYPPDGSDPDGGVPESARDANYEHNRLINFDMRSLIDYQNRSPASDIRMGTSENRNEGWYNGCGWVAAYNALIILDNPQHPAEIVRYYESTGGTVFGGVFGTYPHAIEGYLQGLGYNVEHALFPRVSADIDEAIRTARVGILAYAHTRGAHYATVMYREEDDRFIVYNDSSARARSASLGLQNESRTGAVIDSVSALLRGSPEILFSFSLITVP